MTSSSSEKNITIKTKKGTVHGGNMIFKKKGQMLMIVGDLEGIELRWP